MFAATPGFWYSDTLPSNMLDFLLNPIISIQSNGLDELNTLGYLVRVKEADYKREREEIEE